MKKDKLFHFGVNLVAFLATSAFVSFLLTLFDFSMSQMFWISVLCGYLFAGGLSLGKEYGDLTAAGNQWSWTDMLANVLGMIAGFVLTLLAYLIF